MKKKRKNILILLILLLGIGFAYLSTNLDILGIANVHPSSWNIYFDNVVIVEDTTNGELPTISDNKLEVNYVVNLREPGDIFSFTVDAINDGTINAEIELVSLLGLTESQRRLIDYTVTYDNNSEINIGDILSANSSSTYKVKVFYKEDITEEDLNSMENDTESLSLTFNVKYAQGSKYDFNNSKYSMYVWDTEFYKTYYINDYLDMLENLNISEVYQDLHTEDLLLDSTKEIISTLKSNNIDTYFLTGASSEYNNPNKVKEYIDAIYEYNNRVNANERLVGISLDIEGYSVDEYKVNKPLGFREYSEMIEEVSEYAHNKGLLVANAIPYWYDTYQDDDEFTTDEQALVLTQLETIIKSVDKTCVMNYKKSSSVNHLEDEVRIAKKYNRRIESIAETNRENGDGVTSALTFWSDTDPLTTINNNWKAIGEEYKYNKLEYSYHYAKPMLELYSNHNYKRYVINFTDTDSNIISNAYYALKVNDNIVLTHKISSTGTTNFLFKDPINIIVEGYTVDSLTEVSRNDNIVTYNCILTAGNIYQVEGYVYYNDTDKTPITTGTIYMKSLNSGIIISETPNSSHYFYTNKVAAETEYEVWYEDENGTRHNLTNATVRNQESQRVTVITDNGTVLFPTGLKDNNYLGPSFYFEQ